MNMLVTLLLIALASLTLGYVMNTCPDPSDSKLNLEANTTSVLRSYKFFWSGVRNKTPNGNFLVDMERSNRCKLPQFPDDDPQKHIVSHSRRSRRSPVVTSLSSLSLLPVFVKRSCEPCPAKQHFLGRFYRSCYVLAASQQQVRYVTCNQRCFAPCMCSRSYCQRTAYVRVWFFSYCFRTRGQTFRGGFKPGHNFWYLWLPQDCTCRNV